jgi:hypothetical protein
MDTIDTEETSSTEGRSKRFFTLPKSDSGGIVSKIILATVLILVSVIVILGIFWSIEPNPFSVQENLDEKLELSGREYVTGSATTTALIKVAETLLDKPGGYLSNDVMPPGLYLDNIPNWEFGVLVQVRDLSRSFREAFSRSQSQSTEDPDLIISEPKFHFDNDSWLFPPSESEYRCARG